MPASQAGPVLCDQSFDPFMKGIMWHAILDVMDQRSCPVLHFDWRLLRKLERGVGSAVTHKRIKIPAGYKALQCCSLLSFNLGGGLAAKELEVGCQEELPHCEGGSATRSGVVDSPSEGVLRAGYMARLNTGLREALSRGIGLEAPSCETFLPCFPMTVGSSSQEGSGVSLSKGTLAAPCMVAVYLHPLRFPLDGVAFTPCSVLLCISAVKQLLPFSGV